MVKLEDTDEQDADHNPTNKKTDKEAESQNKNESNPTKTGGDSEAIDSNGKSEYDSMSSSAEPDLHDQLQKDLEDNLCSIQSAELYMKNGNPYKLSVDGSVTSGSTSSKNSHCPIFYGIKSYIHDFYCPPDKEVLDSGEFTQGDDFQLLAEPRRKKNCWVRVGLWLGVNLILLGIIAILVGYLTPQREPIVGQFQGYTVLDRWAMIFNNRLLICQVTGLATSLCGVVAVVCSLLVSSCQPEPTPMYYVMGATLMPESFVGTPQANLWRKQDPHHMPLSSTVKDVQP